MNYHGGEYQNEEIEMAYNYNQGVINDSIAVDPSANRLAMKNEESSNRDSNHIVVNVENNKDKIFTSNLNNNYYYD